MKSFDNIILLSFYKLKEKNSLISSMLDFRDSEFDPACILNMYLEVIYFED